METGKKLIEQEIISTIENDGVKEFARRCVETIPEYFYQVGASSTNKYHPDYALGYNGLVRHTCALVRFLNHFFRMDMYGHSFTDKEKDLLRVACLMHDSRKSGTQTDYEKSKWTVFQHPIMAAEVVRNVNTKDTDISDEEREIIANAIESHMGQWNVNPKSKNDVLPLPSNKFQKILHMVDYLASRKDIEVKFEGVQGVVERNIVKDEPLDIETATFPFGKYKGMLIKEVNEQHPDYIAWCKGKFEDGPIKTLIMSL